jgi:acyl-CoA thioester hydrolase
MQGKKVHVERIVVRWGDMDALGHVNNANYFRYIEQARLSWFERLGCPLDPRAEGPLIITASCTFLKPIVYPATVDVAMSVGEPRRSSFPTYFEIYLEADPAQRFAECESVIVWADYAAGKSKPLPEWLREILAPGRR